MAKYWLGLLGALLAVAVEPCRIDAQQVCPWSLQLIQQQQKAIWTYQQQLQTLQAQQAHQQARANQYIMMQPQPQPHRQGYIPPVASRTQPQFAPAMRPDSPRTFEFKPSALYLPHLKTTQQRIELSRPRFDERTETLTSHYRKNSNEPFSSKNESHQQKSAELFWWGLGYRDSEIWREKWTWLEYQRNQTRMEDLAWWEYLIYQKKREDRAWLETAEYRKQKTDLTWSKHDAPAIKFAIPTAKKTEPLPQARRPDPEPQPAKKAPLPAPPTHVKLPGGVTSHSSSLELEIRSLTAKIHLEKSQIKAELRCTGCHLPKGTSEPNHCSYLRTKMPLSALARTPMARSGLPTPIHRPGDALAFKINRPEIQSRVPRRLPEPAMAWAIPMGNVSSVITPFPGQGFSLAAWWLQTPLGMQPTGGVVPGLKPLTPQGQPRPAGKELNKLVNMLAMPTNPVAESRGDLTLLNPLESPTSQRTKPGDDSARDVSDPIPYEPVPNLDGPSLPALTGSLLLLAPIAPRDADLQRDNSSTPSFTAPALSGAELDLSRPSSLPLPTRSSS